VRETSSVPGRGHIPHSTRPATLGNPRGRQPGCLAKGSKTAATEQAALTAFYAHMGTPQGDAALADGDFHEPDDRLGVGGPLATRPKSQSDTRGKSYSKATSLPSLRNLSRPIQWRGGETGLGRYRRCGQHRDRRGTGIRNPSPSAPWPCGDWPPPNRASRRA
jgi:hypothetical protein